MKKKIGGSTTNERVKPRTGKNVGSNKQKEANAKAAEHAKTRQGRAEERNARGAALAAALAEERNARASGTLGGGKRRTRRNKTRRTRK